MKTKVIDITTFQNFVSNNSFFNFLQSDAYIDYLKITKEKYIVIGVYNTNTLVAASIVLIKKISFNLKYAFMPKGFITNYNDIELLSEINKSIFEFFSSKKYVFIKISPEIILNNINYKDKIKNLNLQAKKICEVFENNNFIIPKYDNFFNKYNAFINLKEFNINMLDEVTKIRLYNINDDSVIRKATINELKYLNLTTSEEKFYKKYSEKYNNYLDYLVIEINYDIYLKLLNNEFEAETEINNQIINNFKNNAQDESLLNLKMISDNKLHDLKSEIVNITKLLSDENNSNKKIIVGSFIITKYLDKVSILKINYGFNNLNINGNYYLIYLLIIYYRKQNYSLLDLNGINEKSLYDSLYDYKINFNPIIYEYIPEYDLVLNQKYYEFLEKTKFFKKK